MKKTAKSYVLGVLTFLMLLPNVALAQTEGQVLDETGEPLYGATVKVQGQKTGTVTDMDGRFRLPDVGRGATLEF